MARFHGSLTTQAGRRSTVAKVTTSFEDPEIRLIQVDLPTPGASTRVVHFVGGPFDGRRELAGTLPVFHALRARRGRVRRWLCLPRRSAVYLRRDTWFEGRSRHGRYEFDGYQRVRPRERV